MKLSVLIAALSLAVANAQAPPTPAAARLVARAGTVEVQRASEWVSIDPGGMLAPGERVRTGAKSSAAIELGPGKVVTLSEKTEVQLRQANGTTLVELDRGNMKVVAAEDIQVAAKETLLESAERPLNLEIGYQADGLNVTVITGAVRNGPIIIKGAQDSSYRTYTADGRWKGERGPIVYPEVYFYPYVIYANPIGGIVPQPPAPQGGIQPPVVLNPTHPGYRPDQIVPPMPDPVRPPVLPFRR